MKPDQIVFGVIFLILSIGTFVISCFQFKEKGFLFNNNYQEERKTMDEDKERKKPYYRQSGFAFMFAGIVFLILAVGIYTQWVWLSIPCVLFAIIDLVYVIVSSIQIERHKDNNN